MYRFEKNPVWNESIYQSIIADSIPKIKEDFNLTDDEIIDVVRHQMQNLSVYCICYKDDVPVMMASGIEHDGGIFIQGFIFKAIDGSRAWIYDDDYLTAGCQFMTDNFAFIKHNEKVNTGMANYIDNIQDTLASKFGGATSNIIEIDAQRWKKREAQRL